MTKYRNYARQIMGVVASAVLAWSCQIALAQGSGSGSGGGNTRTFSLDCQALNAEARRLGVEGSFEAELDNQNRVSEAEMRLEVLGAKADLPIEQCLVVGGEEICTLRETFAFIGRNRNGVQTFRADVEDAEAEFGVAAVGFRLRFPGDSGAWRNTREGHTVQIRRTNSSGVGGTTVQLFRCTWQ